MPNIKSVVAEWSKSTVFLSLLWSLCPKHDDEHCSLTPERGTEMIIMNHIYKMPVYYLFRIVLCPVGSAYESYTIYPDWNLLYARIVHRPYRPTFYVFNCPVYVEFMNNLSSGVVEHVSYGEDWCSVKYNRNTVCFG